MLINLVLKKSVLGFTDIFYCHFHLHLLPHWSLFFPSFYRVFVLLFLLPLDDRLCCLLKIIVFLRKTHVVIKFPCITAFAVSHKFFKNSVFIFICVTFFLIYSLIPLLTHCFLSIMLFSLHVFVLFSFFFL